MSKTKSCPPHFWDTNIDNTESVCRKCGKIQKEYSFDEIYDNKMAKVKNSFGTLPHVINRREYSSQVLIGRLLRK